MRNNISFHECTKGLIFPTIVGVECNDFPIKYFFSQVL